MRCILEAFKKYRMQFFLFVLCGIGGLVVGTFCYNAIDSCNPYIYNGKVSSSEWSTVFVSKLLITDEYVEVINSVDNGRTCEIQIVDISGEVIEETKLLPGRSIELEIKEREGYLVQCKSLPTVDHYRIAVLTKPVDLFDYILAGISKIM